MRVLIRLQSLLKDPLTFVLSLLCLLTLSLMHSGRPTRCGIKWGGAVTRDSNGSLRVLGDWTPEYERGGWATDPEYVGDFMLLFQSGPMGALAFTRDVSTASLRLGTWHPVAADEATTLGLEFLDAWLEEGFETSVFTASEIRSLAPGGVVRHTTVISMGYALNGLVALLGLMTVTSGYACSVRSWKWLTTDHDPTRCQNCHYSLIGLPESVAVCPECGEMIGRVMTIEDGLC